MKTIVALTGLKTSGKSTAFNFIKEARPQVVEITLAKKLKDECSRVLKIERELFDDPARKEVEFETPVYLDRHSIEQIIESYGKTPDYDLHVRPHVGQVLESPRRVAQYVGTEVLRNVDLDIHCIGATMSLPADGLFVVTDMRFLSEFAFFKKHYNFEFFPVFVQSDRAEFNANDPHPSEREVPLVGKLCRKVSNNSTLGDFQKALMDLLADLGA